MINWESGIWAPLVNSEMQVAWEAGTKMREGVGRWSSSDCSETMNDAKVWFDFLDGLL